MSFWFFMLVFVILALIFYCSKELVKHFCSSLNLWQHRVWHWQTFLFLSYNGQITEQCVQVVYLDFVRFVVGWNLEMELILFFFDVKVRSHLTITMCFFFFGHVRTVTLVTMQPIFDDIKKYADNIKILCHCHQVWTLKTHNFIIVFVI